MRVSSVEERAQIRAVWPYNTSLWRSFFRGHHRESLHSKVKDLPLRRRGSGKTCKTVNIVAIIFGKDKSLPETPFDEVVAGSVFILLDITRHLSTITSRPDGHSYLHG